MERTRPARAHRAGLCGTGSRESQAECLDCSAAPPSGLAALSQVPSRRKACARSSERTASDRDRFSPRFLAEFGRAVFYLPAMEKIALACRRPRPVASGIAGELHRLPPESRPIDGRLIFVPFR